MFSPNVIGFELIVSDLSAAVAFFRDALQFELLDQFSNDDPVGRMAVFNAGAIAITLFEPAEAGPGFVLPDREPRLSQMILNVPAAHSDTAAERIAEHGVAVQRAGDGRFFVPPATVAGLLGFEAAIVVTDATDQPAG